MEKMGYQSEGGKGCKKECREKKRELMSDYVDKDKVRHTLIE